MKTPEQIRAWLESREWWPQFVKNTVDYDYLTEEVLGGDRGEDTIIDAFGWFTAPEGPFFWQDRNREFKEWYFGENNNEEYENRTGNHRERRSRTSDEPTICKEHEIVLSLRMFAGGMTFITVIYSAVRGDWADLALNFFCFALLMFLSIEELLKG